MVDDGSVGSVDERRRTSFAEDHLKNKRRERDLLKFHSWCV